MFDVKELHLGHLAKAFALRERPGTMGRGSTSEGSRKAHDRHGRSERGVTGRNSGAGARARTGHDEDGIVAVTDMQEAARKMRRTMNMQNAGAGEFNIG
jgi:ATP-dependent RNA helicase DDX31/DBP7